METSRDAILAQYSFLFPFERDFEPKAAKTWLEENWHTSVYYSIIYVIFIFSTKSLMRNRKPFALNKLLILWNLILAAFSILSFLRITPEFLYSFKNGGIYATTCNARNYTDDPVSSFWTITFILSKVIELGDTVFIVLRKSPLAFLHWYHHILTLIYSWYSGYEFNAPSRWFAFMNAFIHSFMYSYYALKAMKVRVPKSLAVLITFSQITQMAIGCYINYVAFYYYTNNVPCNVSLTNLVVSSAMYLSYLLLFVNFFYHSYLSKGKGKAKRS